MAPNRSKRTLFEPKDMVLAKMTGFPAWPSFVMPPDMIPAAILKAKRKTTNTCVIFIPDGDFNWMNEKSLESLSPEKLQSKLNKVPKDKMKPKTKKKTARTNNVVDALIAANGLDFDEFMESLNHSKLATADDLAEVDDDIEADEIENEPENPEEDVVKKDEDDLEIDEDESADKVKPDIHSKSKQRQAKKDSSVERRKSLRSMRNGNLTAESDHTNGNSKQNGESADESLKNNGGRQVSVSLKEELDSDVDVLETSLSRKRPRSSRREAVSSSQNKEDSKDKSTIKDEEAKSEEPAAKRLAGEYCAGSPKPMSEKDRQHQLWLCRIKLQRSLIQRNQPVTPKDPRSFPPPTVDELLMARIILQKLADFPVTVELLRDTKIHKVLKCIVKDSDLEYPESFQLHEKCKELLAQWHDLIESLKGGKSAKSESRIGSTAPEDSEISGIDIKPTLDKKFAEKIEA